MTLQLILVNNSKDPGSLVVYQQYGPEKQSNPLAWFAKYVYPLTQVSFSWDPTDLDFVWSATGKLEPGVVFEASQVVPANLGSTNEITFSYDGTNHVFYFNGLRTGQQQGVFTIVQDGSLPLNAAAVGIGMAGRATFAIQAEPDLTVTIASGNPTYWVTFAQSMQQGEVMISTALAPVQVVFPMNVNSMTVTLNADNTWTVEPNIMMSALI